MADKTETNDVEMTENMEDIPEVKNDSDNNKQESASSEQNENINAANSQLTGSEKSSIQSDQNQKKKAAQLRAKIESKLEAKKRKIAEKKAFKQGVPLSGKWWKDTERKKFSSIKNKDLKVSRNLALIKAQRDERQFILEHKKNTMEAREATREQKREKRKVNQIRTLENQLKSEKVQIIKNPNTVKKMKRNQRKTIETRDLSALKPQNLVK